MFKKTIDSINNGTLQFQYQLYKSEDHGTISLPATFDALKFIFDGYWTDFKKTAISETYIPDSYNNFSEKINFRFQPSEPMLDFTLNYFKKQHKEVLAKYILLQYQKLYPLTAPKHL
ncbi:MAG: hypothetical protein ACK5NK_14770 [Niabella sp.]